MLDLHKENNIVLKSQWFGPEVYKPAFRDTIDDIPEFSEELPGPVTTVSSRFDFRSDWPETGKKRLQSDYDWIAIVLLTGFLLLAFARYNFPRRMGQLLKACLMPRSVANLYREGNPFGEQITTVLGIVFLLTSSLFLFMALDFFGWLPADLISSRWLYAGILVINTFYFLAKTLSIKIIAHIFKTHEASANYLLNNLLFNITIGIFFLLALPFVIYTGSELIFFITLSFTAILLIYKVLRGALAGSAINRFPAVYLIMYIIFIEIAPLLLIAKFFSNTMNV
jgi:hypothetical protein